MRILIVSQFYPPVLGGVEAHVHGLAHALASRGHDVAVATLGIPGVEDEDGVAVYRLRGTAQRIGALHATERRHAPPAPDPEAVLGLRRIVRDFAPDVVHAHNWLGRSFVPLAARSGARFVVTMHDCGRTCAQGRRMRRGDLCEGPERGKCRACCGEHYGRAKGAAVYAANEAMRAREARVVDSYVAVSAAIADANALGESGVPFEVVPNFATLVAPDPAAAGGLPDEPFILQVGDVVPDKGVGVLLDAYGRLADPPKLVLLGRVDERALPRALPGGVRVLGPRTPAFVSAAYERALFVTAPSLCNDACPTATLEAMAASRPVIASKRGGLTDQVANGTTGLLVEPGDAAALAHAMATVLGDAELRRRMGGEARVRFERRFSAEVVVGRIEKLYVSLVEGVSETSGTIDGFPTSGDHAWQTSSRSSTARP